MVTDHTGSSISRRGPEPELWAVLGILFISLGVIPVIVFGVGVLGWQLPGDNSTMVFGFLGLLPGVLMGIGALIVMLGSR